MFVYFLHLSIYLSVCLSVCFFLVCLSICRLYKSLFFKFLFSYASVSLFTLICLFQSVCLCLCLSQFVCFIILLSPWLFSLHSCFFVAFLCSLSHNIYIFLSVVFFYMYFLPPPLSVCFLTFFLCLLHVSYIFRQHVRMSTACVFIYTVCIYVCQSGFGFFVSLLCMFSCLAFSLCMFMCLYEYVCLLYACFGLLIYTSVCVSVFFCLFAYLCVCRSVCLSV